MYAAWTPTRHQSTSPPACRPADTPGSYRRHSATRGQCRSQKCELRQGSGRDMRRDTVRMGQARRGFQVILATAEGGRPWIRVALFPRAPVVRLAGPVNRYGSGDTVRMLGRPTHLREDVRIVLCRIVLPYPDIVAEILLTKRRVPHKTESQVWWNAARPCKGCIGGLLNPNHHGGHFRRCALLLAAWKPRHIASKKCLGFAR